MENKSLNIRLGNKFKWFLTHYTTLIAIMIIFFIFGILNPKFLSVDNLLLILGQMAPLLLIAMGFTFVFIVGEFDLSIGVIATASSAFVLGFESKGFSIFSAIILTFLIAMALGALNGSLIGYLRLPSAITTLGTKLLFTGIIILYTQDMNIFNNIPLKFTKFGQGSVIGFPNIAIFSLAVFLILYFLTTTTKVTYHLYASSCEENIAISLGINPKLAKLSAFMVGAVLAAMGGIIISAKTGLYYSSQAGGVYLLDTIIAVFIGKAIIKEGQPHILGTFFGVFLISIIRNGTNILGLSLVLQYIIIGLAFILVLISEAMLRKSVEE